MMVISSSGRGVTWSTKELIELARNQGKKVLIFDDGTTYLQNRNKTMNSITNLPTTLCVVQVVFKQKHGGKNCWIPNERFFFDPISKTFRTKKWKNITHRVYSWSHY